jgi:DNA-binding GntR family transcriptional regulator
MASKSGGAAEMRHSKSVKRPVRQLATRVVEHLERMIADGTLAAGERINEAVLADTLGVSRAPVREALNGLEAKGLLTKIANRGTFVRELSVKEMLDIFEMRALLMGYGAECATELFNDERKAALSALLDRMDESTRNNDGVAYYRLNQEFHKTILSYSGNRRAMEVYDELEKDLQRFRRHYFDFTSNMTKSNIEHRAVFEAMRRGDGAAARELAVNHVQHGKLRVLQTLE